MKPRRENFYRRNPDDALAGMVGMSLEERGVYNTVIDLVYLTWRPLEDNRGYIANHCGCAVQKLNPILDRLIERRKLLRFEEDGVWYISNRRFEDERTEVKGAGSTRSGRGKVGEKSAGVSEKSAGVEENPPVLDIDPEENQPVKPLEKRRVEESKRSIDLFVASAKPTATIAVIRDPWEADPSFRQLWDAAPPLMRKRAKSKAKVWPEWQRAARRSDPQAIVAGFVRYKSLDADLPRSGGPGLHIWLRDRTWEQWASADAASTESLGLEWTESRWAAALGIWHEDGSWDARLGPKPNEVGCRAPASLLIRVVNSRSAA